MAVQTYPYLAISDGVTNVVMQDGAGGATNYPLTRGGWAPAVAGLRAGALGGRGQYQDVIEEFEIDVTGADVATMYANLQTLNSLLDQAERWYDYRENVNPVTLRYAPQGSTIASTAAPLQRLILGRAPGNRTEGALGLPEEFDMGGLIGFMTSVRVRIWCRGQWMGATETANGLANAPSIVSITLPSNVTTYSPTDIGLEQLGNTAQLNIPASYLLVSQPRDAVAGTQKGLELYEAETGTATGFTSVADAANQASGNILRYTPTTTNYTPTGYYITTDLDSATRVDFFAAVRNNSGTTSFQVYVSGQTTGAAAAFTTTPILIDTSSPQPRIVWLGTLVLRFPLYNFRIYVKASAASGTLDIDYIAAIARDRQPSLVLALDAFTGPILGLIGGEQKMVVQHNMLTDRTAQVNLYDIGGGSGPNLTPLSYRGAPECYTRGTKVYVAWLTTSGQYWRYAPGGTLKSVTFSLTRQKGYLTPQ